MQEDLDRSRRCQAAIKQKPTSMDRTTIEQTESFSMDREVIELDKKTFFQREEKHTEKNAIKQATQPKIQTTFKTLKNISQQKNAKHIRSKHTHIH